MVSPEYPSYPQEVPLLHEEAASSYVDPAVFPLDPVIEGRTSEAEERERLERIERADEWKEKGNEALKEGNFDEAVEYYNDALDCIDESFPKEAAVYFANRALAHYKRGDYDGSLLDANESVQFNPTYVKAYIRQYKAYEAMEKWNEAKQCLEEAVQLDPSLEATYRTALQKLTREAEAKFEKDKEEMMEKLKSGANWLLGKVGLSTDNFKFEQDPATGSYNVKFEQSEGSNPNFNFKMGE